MGVMESEEKKIEKERKKLEADKNKLELEKEKLQLKQDKENFEKEKKAFNKKKKKLEAKDNSAEDSDQADDENDEFKPGTGMVLAVITAFIFLIAWLSGWNNWVFHVLIILSLFITIAISADEADAPDNEILGVISWFIGIGMAICYYIVYIGLGPIELIKKIISFFS